jgi:chromosome segregation ATPase
MMTLQSLLGNGPMLTMLLALVASLLSVASFFQQRNRDRVDYASKVAKAAIDLNAPLERRVSELEKDNARFEGIIETMKAQHETLQGLYEEQKYKLMVVEKDRENLLRRLTVLQTENELLKRRVAELEQRIRGDDEETDDPRG